jgi:hypothetical protein
LKYRESSLFADIVFLKNPLKAKNCSTWSKALIGKIGLWGNKDTNTIENKIWICVGIYGNDAGVPGCEVVTVIR